MQVSNGARLVVLPGPTIPFVGCRYYQRARIDVEAGASLIWGDVWLPGRYARGDQSERFRFDQMVQDLEVRCAGLLVYRERFAWRGPWDAETVRGALGPGEAAGSLFVSGRVLEGSTVSTPSTAGAILYTAGGDTCIRWCGSPAAVTRAVVRTALTIAGGWSAGAGAPPWLLDSSHLAPNHWFSSTGAETSLGRSAILE